MCAIGMLGGGSRIRLAAGAAVGGVVGVLPAALAVWILSDPIIRGFWTPLVLLLIALFCPVLAAFIARGASPAEAMLAILILIVVFFFGLRLGLLGTVAELATTNLEMVFLVSDANTGQPIPGAKIDLWDEDGKSMKGKICELITNREGRAQYYHENKRCEYITCPFRKTVTLIDLTWASATIATRGYRSSEPIWLHAAKYQKQAFFSKRNCHRLVFDIPLRKE